MSASPAVELAIDAESLDTKRKRRDEHLRADDFFDVVNHPQVRFEANAATLDGNTPGPAGGCTPAASTSRSTSTHRHPADGEFEIEATALADHRELGITWSPMGILRAPSKPIIRGRLLRAEDAR